jgi:polyferredoxin
MMKWWRVAGLLALLAFQVLAGDSPASSGYSIPSSDELNGNQAIANYRANFKPELYLPESNVWPFADLAVLAAMLVAGGMMVWRRAHSRWFWIPAAVTLGYFGFIRGGCICPVGSVANMAIALAHPTMIGKTTALMFFLPLLAALVMGRMFCVSGCPLGAIQHLLGGGKNIHPPAALERSLRWLPVAAMIATAWLAVRGGCLLVCILDPYKTAFFFGYGWIHRAVNWLHGGLVEPRFFWVGDLTAWGILLGSLLLGWWVQRPFCRFVCPYSVLLGAFSAVSLKRREIAPEQCIKCGICEKTCPVNAIARDAKTGEFKISSFHCIQCNRCSSHCPTAAHLH